MADKASREAAIQKAARQSAATPFSRRESSDSSLPEPRRTSLIDGLPAGPVRFWLHWLRYQLGRPWAAFMEGWDEEKERQAELRRTR